MKWETEYKKMRIPFHYDNKPTVCIVSGGNISKERFDQMVTKRGK